MNQEPDRVAESARNLVIDYGLRRVKVLTDTHIIEVREPSWWDDTRELIVTIQKIDL